MYVLMVIGSNMYKDASLNINFKHDLIGTIHFARII